MTEVIFEQFLRESTAMHHRVRRSLAIALLVLCARSAWAGIGPENVLVVINANSATSREIAHRYARLRSIPDNNLVYLDWRLDGSEINLEQFHQYLLRPILTAIATRGLTSQIDCVAYSCDLPYVVDFAQADDHVPVVQDAPPRSELVASVTGLTYLWQLIDVDRSLFTSLNTNRYYRAPDPGTGDVASHGFGSWYGWSETGEILETGQGARYLLCTKLGVTSGVHVNTREEILYYLRRIAAADGARPDGTMYFVRNGNVRSTARHDAFPAIVRQLRENDVAAEVLRGRLPDDRNDVQGLTIGTSKFDWSASGSHILPGAICDNLTSYGGALHRRTRQSTIDQFLRNGAAGASGTVGEPLAIQAKFPTPAIQLHYARGATLAEAFYQSVAAPYQLLVVGDPLCRPWARIPQITVRGLQNGQQVTGTVSITPGGASDSVSKYVDRFKLFIDGRRIARCTGGESFALDTRHFADGWHEVRVVGIAATAIATQGRRVLNIAVNNHGRSVQITGLPTGSVDASETLSFTVQSAGAKRIWLFCHGQPIAEIPGPVGTVRMPAATLGRGPVALRAVALSTHEPYATSKPVQLNIISR